MIRLERIYQAPVQDVWDLWTTKDGIESWWGPDGFRVEVHELDLKPGGELLYSMIAATPEMIATMKQLNMPPTNKCKITYTEVVPRKRLAYDNLVDFVPGVAAYSAATLVELAPDPAGVRMTLTLEPMHDGEWTQRAVMGWESELGKLERRLAARATSSTGRTA